MPWFFVTCCAVGCTFYKSFEGEDREDAFRKAVDKHTTDKPKCDAVVRDDFRVEPMADDAID